MKVTLKQLLKYVPVICILLGLLLIGGGFAMADFKMENLQTVEHKPYMKREKTITMHQISSIRIDSYHSEINILPAKDEDRKSTRLNSSHSGESRMPSSA